MASVRHEIGFILNDLLVKINDVRAEDTLLDFLRLNQNLTGTKEGCAEGDCGACTVLVGKIIHGELEYENVNACIRLLPSLDGCHVVTIEHLQGINNGLHPIQQAMVDHHGSQCGFCTPGVIMSLYALWMKQNKPSKQEIEIALQGNLCRCTGYNPIIKAAVSMNEYGSIADDILNVERPKITSQLLELNDGKHVEIISKGSHTIIPATISGFADSLLKYPDATIIAGATDVGLWVTKMMRSISPAIFIGDLTDLKYIHVDKDEIHIGAGVTYSEVNETIQQYYPYLTLFWNRIGGAQVRNMGTVGGNIANGSPIGDTPPILIALGADITLRQGEIERRIPLDTYFIAYGKQNIQTGEFIQSIHIPLPAQNSKHAAYKISKRKDEDISSVCVAFNIGVENDKIISARIALGGMAAIPKRAINAEESLLGKPWKLDSFKDAAQMLDQDFEPLSDWRASTDYRMLVAKNLFTRFYLEQSDADQPIRLEGI